MGFLGTLAFAFVHKLMLDLGCLTSGNRSV